MKLNKKIAITFCFLLFISLFSQFVLAWGGETHVRLCPEDYSINCNIADSHKFQKDNPYANTIYHVCYDNPEDCMPRLAAKYFLKKYYVEGETNQDLLGAAAHLFQDASCPAHWYPGFEIFGKIVYPTSPRWVKTIEGEVDSKFLSKEENWNIPIKFKGESINIDKDYLNTQKEYLSEFLSQEPEESIETIESQLKSKLIWHRLRGYQGFIIILIIFLVPFLGYELWKYKKEKIISSDLIITATALLILMTLFVLIKLFYK